MDVNTNFLTFNDFRDVSEWAKPAIMWAIGRSLISGSNRDLKPQGGAIRARADSILRRFCENIEE